MRVLVVDDERTLAQVLCRVLELAKPGPWTAENVSTGEAALARLAETSFDVVVTDLVLPEMDGLEVLRRVKMIQPRARTVLITAYGASQLPVREIELADAYLPKPFSLKVFTEVVRRLVETGAPTASNVKSPDGRHQKLGAKEVAEDVKQENQP